MAKDFSKIKRMDYVVRFDGFEEHLTALWNIDDFSEEEIQKMTKTMSEYPGVIVCHTEDFERVFRDVMNTDSSKL